MSQTHSTSQLSRRERFALLCELNSDLLQWHAEQMLDQMGWAAATALLALVKRVTDGQIGRRNLGDVIRWAVLKYFSDETFDEFVMRAQQWLGEL